MDALGYLRNNVVEERVLKREDRPEADRIKNYPWTAVEEALSNAVYHKSYQIPEPVTVTVTPYRMEITSVPGPFREITDEDLARGHLVSRNYRNRRIGDYLKELHLAEAKNTGVPLMMRAMALNGSPPPVFQTDPGRGFLTVVLPVHEAFLDPDAPAGMFRSRPEPEKLVISRAMEGWTSIDELIATGGRDRNVLRGIVSMLVSDGTLEPSADGGMVRMACRGMTW